MLVMINYQQKQAKKNYMRLMKAIEFFGETIQPIEGCFLVATTSALSSIYENLKKLVDTDDVLLVHQFNIENAQGWISQHTWNWIKSKSYYSELDL